MTGNDHKAHLCANQHNSVRPAPSTETKGKATKERKQARRKQKKGEEEEEREKKEKEERREAESHETTRQQVQNSFKHKVSVNKIGK